MDKLHPGLDEIGKGLREAQFAPLKRAEAIVKDGPDLDPGKQPCEGGVEAQCLTFRQLNRMRFFRAECGCLHRADGADLSGGDLIATEDNLAIACEDHGGGTLAERKAEERQWIDTMEMVNFTIAGMAGGLTEEFDARQAEDED